LGCFETTTVADTRILLAAYSTTAAGGIRVKDSINYCGFPLLREQNSEGIRPTPAPLESARRTNGRVKELAESI